MERIREVALTPCAGPTAAGQWSPMVGSAVGEARPLVSVILSTYDQCDYVVEAVESVLAQTYPSIELLVIDNGSNDGSADLLRPYVDRGHLRLFAHSENAPLTRRLNEAVRASRGEFVSILFGDDYYLPRKIERQVQEFSGLTSDYGVVYSPGYWLDQRTRSHVISPTPTASGMIIGPILESYGRAAISPIAPLIRRACLIATPFDEAVRLIADSVFMFLALSYRFRFVDEPLVVMRWHGANSGWAYRRNFEDGLVIFDHLQRHPRFPPALRGRIVAINASQSRDLAWKVARFGARGGDARGYLLRAVRWQRIQVVHPRTIAAFLLSLLPDVLRRAVNEGISVVRGRRGELVYREDYR